MALLGSHPAFPLTGKGGPYRSGSAVDPMGPGKGILTALMRGSGDSNPQLFSSLASASSDASGACRASGAEGSASLPMTTMTGKTCTSATAAMGDEHRNPGHPFLGHPFVIDMPPKQKPGYPPAIGLSQQWLIRMLGKPAVIAESSGVDDCADVSPEKDRGPEAVPNELLLLRPMPLGRLKAVLHRTLPLHPIMPDFSRPPDEAEDPGRFRDELRRAHVAR